MDRLEWAGQCSGQAGPTPHAIALALKINTSKKATEQAIRPQEDAVNLCRVDPVRLR